MNTSLAGEASSGTIIRVLAVCIVLYAAFLTTCDISLTLLDLLGNVVDIPELQDLLKERQQSGPLWMHYGVTVWNCILVPFLVVSAVGLFTAERWALPVARIALGADFVSALLVTGYWLLQAGVAAADKAMEDAVPAAQSAGSVCCCGMIPLILLLALSSPNARLAWQAMLEREERGSAGGSPSVPSPPSAPPPPPAPPAPLDSDVWRPPTDS